MDAGTERHVATHSGLDVIVGSGFALFFLSGFPPTQRLGVLVCVGAVLTDLVVLIAAIALIAYRTG
jgi:predicted RND superfamily exporter protein